MRSLEMQDVFAAGRLVVKIGVRDEVINVPANIDAGFTTAVEDKQIILRRQFFVLEYVFACLQLFFRHRMLCVSKAPNANGLMTCGGKGGGRTDFAQGGGCREILEVACRTVRNGI